MKLLTALTLLVLGSLSGCASFIIATYDPAVYLAPRQICRWQKADSVGRTNAQLRWQDFQDCGVLEYVDGSLDLNVRYEGMNSNDVDVRSERIVQCIRGKGYIYFTEWDCVDKKGKSTGKCNCETPEDLKQ